MVGNLEVRLGISCQNHQLLLGCLQLVILWCLLIGIASCSNVVRRHVFCGREGAVWTCSCYSSSSSSSSSSSCVSLLSRFFFVCMSLPYRCPFPCESWIWLDSQFRIALWFYVMFCAGCIAIAHCFRPLLAHPSLEAINLWKFVCPTFTCFTMFLNGCVPTKNGSTKTIPFFGVIRPKSCICLWGCSLVNPTTNKQRDISPFFLNKPLHTVAEVTSADHKSGSWVEKTCRESRPIAWVWGKQSNEIEIMKV